MVGIYKIENKINGHKYIGQSVSIKGRWKDEVRRAYDINDNNYDTALSRAIRKYTVDGFTFEIIEECKREELNDKERYWIHYYDSFFNGYNLTLGGDGSGTRKKKDSIIGVINDLKTTNMYHKEIAEKWNMSQEMVQGINTGRYWYSDYENYPLQKQHKERVIKCLDGQIKSKKCYCIDCGAEVSKGAERCIECAKIFSRKVNRPSKEELYEHLIKIQGNFTQAGSYYGVSDNTIRKWCKAYDIPFHSSNYKPRKELNSRAGQTKIKRVAQIDLDNGEILAIYASISDACRAIKVEKGSSHISAVCQGKRKSAYGYSWQYC